MDYTKAIQTLFKDYVNTDDYFDKEFISYKISYMLKCLRRLDIAMDAIDNLNIIHVTGTKGKGSTCAFTENLLRHHGYKTGVFVSPHLVEVRERILINGLPLEKSTFAKYFFDVHNRLQETKDGIHACFVSRFAMYVLLSMHVFIQENVDVVVLEVGVGGENDCTNFIRKPWVCLMTSIALDHKEELGGSVESVTWNKTGIFKDGAVAFIGQIKNPNVLEIIKSRGAEKNVPVYFVPDLNMYGHAPGASIKLGVPGRIQEENASIALQAAHYWIARRQGSQYINIAENTSVHEDKIFPVVNPFSLSETMLEGLSNARIICRNQIVRKPGLTYYIDGAHTYESIQLGIDWFVEESEQERKDKSGNFIKILIFYLAPNRTPEAVMPPLAKLDVDAVAFVPLNLYSEGFTLDRNQERSQQTNIKTCFRNMRMWHKLKGTRENEQQVFSCVQDALEWATQGRDELILRKPSCLIVPFTDEDQDNDTQDQILTNGFDSTNGVHTISKTSECFSDADHIQIFATGGLSYSGGVLHLVMP